MSIFDNQPPRLMDYVQDGLTLKRDKELIDGYVASTQGIGLESLEQSPSNKLILQGLADRYPKHFQVSAGNEGLIMLAAIIGGGYLVYKKMMRSKNNPVLKDVADADKKVEKTYDAEWISGKSSVGGQVSCGELSAYFNGSNFNAISTEAAKSVKELTDTLVEVTSEAIKLWFKLAPIIRNWVGATSEEDKKKYYDEMKKVAPKNPWGDLNAKIKEKMLTKTGKAGKVEALSESDYAKATALLKDAVDALVKIDNASEDLWMDVGFWDLFDDVESDTDEADEMWAYGYAENIGDHFGRTLFAARTSVLDVSRGLEEWIIKSFK
ncbi:hypothetical protein pEaSNUABM37_00195 [Erwinia phage pEa_SNUABM_37]|nr:hypothetical protein pEaSNUABM37_00195 [Erwinia phage pEa_SNUABM_37]QXO10665.1 hypothetical protein pEaSNUABM48_00195 [Erwinia phage pEa_SNUABM_48]